jgi:predicted DNA-binding transcriptional regulator AlpA
VNGNIAAYIDASLCTMLQYAQKEVISMENNPYLTLAQAMKEFDISRQNLYRLRKDGKLPEYRLGGRIYVDINDLLALIRKVEGNHESPG